MPLFMDIHDVPGATSEDLANAHEADLKVQGQHGVQCLKYWFNEDCGKVFCLFDAPSAEAANAVHREAHGLLAEKIIEVDPAVADGLLGNGQVDAAGAVLVPGSSRQRDTGVRSIMFTDIVGSTEMTQRLGDAAAFELLSYHDLVVREELAAEGGREVKHTGDGLMICFDSPCAAVQCARRIQQRLAVEVGADGAPRLRLRIGAAAGEPIERGSDLFGSTVQLAARLCAHAEPGTVLVSNAVAEMCLGKGVRFTPPYDAQLKGFDQPIHACEVELAA